MVSYLETIPFGYKQTEIGVIPEDWGVCCIRDIAKVVGGGTPSTQVPKYWNGNINWLTPTEIGIDKYVSDSKRKLTLLGLQKSSASMLPKGTILLTSRAGIGDLGILNIPSCTNQGFQSLVVSDRVDNEFLYYVMLTKRSELERKASGSTFLEISPSEIKSLLIPLPRKNEQLAISQVLSDLDSQIQALNHLLIKKRDIKQGTMQILLTGKTRLPGFDNNWINAILGEVGTCYRGVSYNPNYDLFDYDEEHTVRLFRSNNIQNGLIDLNNIQYVHSNRVSKSQYLQNNDVVICMANGSRQLVGKSAIFEKMDSFSYTFGAFMGCFRTNKKIACPKFVSYLFQTETYRIHIDILLSGSAINNLRPSAIEELKVRIPSLKEQKAIAEVLSDMDAEINALEQRLEKTKAIKQGMMQQLLTGRIRLVEPSTPVEANS